MGRKVGAFRHGGARGWAKNRGMASLLDHDRLEVYHYALQFDRQANVLLRTAGVRGDKRDQLRRAAASIVLNIAEGAGEFSPKDKARFYRYARRSATECAAVLDLLMNDYGLDPAALAEPRKSLSSIIAMLVRLLQTLDPTIPRRTGKRPPPSDP